MARKIPPTGRLCRGRPNRGNRQANPRSGECIRGAIKRAPAANAWVRLQPVSQIVSNSRDNTSYSFVQSNANVSDMVNGLNQIIATGGTGLSHDARGNTIAIGATSYAL